MAAIKELHIRRKNGKPLTMADYKGNVREFTKFAQIGRVFQGQYGQQINVDQGFSIVLKGTGEVIPFDELWLDLKEPYAQRMQDKAQEQTPPADDNEPLPF